MNKAAFNNETKVKSKRFPESQSTTQTTANINLIKIKYQAKIDEARKLINELQAIKLSTFNAEIHGIIELAFSAMKTQQEMYNFQSVLEKEKRSKKAPNDNIIVQQRASKQQESLKTIDDDLEIITKTLELSELHQAELSSQLLNGPTQLVSNLMLMAENINKTIGMDNNKSTSMMKQFIDVSKEAYNELRNMQYDLHPASLHDAEITKTMREFQRRFTERNKIQSRFTVVGDSHAPNRTKTPDIFRLFQVLLKHIVNSLNPTIITTELSIDGDKFITQIDHDGDQFNLSNLKHESKQSDLIIKRYEQSNLSIDSETLDANLQRIVLDIPND